MKKYKKITSIKPHFQVMNMKTSRLEPLVKKLTEKEQKECVEMNGKFWAILFHYLF